MSRPDPAVRLRPVEDGDIAMFFAQQADPIAAEMAEFESRDRVPFFARWAAIRADPTVRALTVVASDVPVGHVVSWSDDGRRLVGYWIDRSSWGRGIATAALRLLLDEDAERPVFAHVAVGNIGSRRVLEHCGFAREREAVDADGVREAIYRLD
jgi:RimJ/RimL family protein N-acetyltransferase